MLPNDVTEIVINYLDFCSCIIVLKKSRDMVDCRLIYIY